MPYPEDLNLAIRSSTYAVITIAIRLRYATTIRLRRIARPCFQFDASEKMNVSIFRRSRIVVLSQSNRTHIVIPITFVVVECVVVSLVLSMTCIVPWGRD